MQAVRGATMKGENMNPWYVTGFCEGEASFTFSRNGKNNIALYFAVKLTAADSDLVEGIRDFFGVGKIYPVKKIEAKEKCGRTKSAAYYRVSALGDLLPIVEHFDTYPLQGKKRERYELWKRALRLKIDRPEGYKDEAWKIAESLSAMSPKSLLWE